MLPTSLRKTLLLQPIILPELPPLPLDTIIKVLSRKATWPEMIKLPEFVAYNRIISSHLSTSAQNHLCNIITFCNPLPGAGLCQSFNWVWTFSRKKGISPLSTNQLMELDR